MGGLYSKPSLIFSFPERIPTDPRAATTAPVKVPGEVTKYTLQAQIGVGQTHSYVFRAECAGKEYALKFRLVEEEEDLGTYSNEVQQMIQLEHPNIVCFYNLFTSTAHKKKWLYMVLELVEGITVQVTVTLILQKVFDQMKDQRPARVVPVELKTRWLVQLCRGLAYLHSQNRIHRSICPKNCLPITRQNLLLDRTSGDLKISEFSLAKTLSDGFTGSILDLPTVPHYFAPEMMHCDVSSPNSLRYGLPADVWAAGLVIAELLSDCAVNLPPIRNWGSPADLAKWGAYLDSLVRPLPDLELARLIKDCFAMDPQTRPTMHALVNSPVFRSYAVCYGLPHDDATEAQTLELVQRPQFLFAALSTLDSETPEVLQWGLELCRAYVARLTDSTFFSHVQNLLVPKLRRLTAVPAVADLLLYVAAKPAPPPSGLTAAPWFHTSHGESALSASPPGTFLVRPKAAPNQYMLLWNDDGCVLRRSTVTEEAGGWYFNEAPHARYPTAADLIQACSSFLHNPFQPPPKPSTTALVARARLETFFTFIQPPEALHHFVDNILKKGLSAADLQDFSKADLLALGVPPAYLDRVAAASHSPLARARASDPALPPASPPAPEKPDLTKSYQHADVLPRAMERVPSIKAGYEQRQLHRSAGIRVLDIGRNDDSNAEGPREAGLASAARRNSNPQPRPNSQELGHRNSQEYQRSRSRPNSQDASGAADPTTDAARQAVNRGPVQSPVTLFLIENDLEQYVEIFKAQGFRWLMDLHELTDADLRDLGIDLMGHRKRLLAAVRLLRLIKS